MTITTDFNGTENYAERMAGLEAIHDWWFGTGSFASAATLGQVRANLNSLLVGTTILNREIFATWFAKVNTLNEPGEYVAGLLFGDDEPGGLWQCTLPASLRAATDGTGEAAIGGSIARINDSSGNGLHLTQASTSLRPIRGRRPKSGVRNVLTSNSLIPGGTDRTVETGFDSPLGAGTAIRVTASGGGTPHVNWAASGIVGSHMGSVYVKAGSLSFMRFGIYRSSETWAVLGVVNLADGTTPVPASIDVQDAGDGWWRVSSVAPANPTTGAVLYAYLAEDISGTPPASAGGTILVAGPQFDKGSTVTPAQVRAANGLDFTETGVESVSYAAFDLVDDVLSTGAIAGGLTGQAFVAGAGGCYVSGLSVASGGTFAIGGTSHTWTGAPPGILRAVTGNTGRVLDAMIRAGTYTEDEIARLERYYRALGGKGLLVPDGVELIANGGFDTDLSGWTFDGDGAANTVTWHPSGAARLVSDGSVANKLTPALTMVPGEYYLCTFDLTITAGAVKPWDGDRYVVFASSGTHSLIVRNTGSGNLNFPRNSGATDVLIDNVSVQRLIPREDL